jgi:hypothetical protein
MIVRIPSEGQWQISGAEVEALDEIDNQIVDVVAHEDEQQFVALLEQMLDFVRRYGRPLPVDQLRESNIILPPADATLEEVRGLFAHEGLIVD